MNFPILRDGGWLWHRLRRPYFVLLLVSLTVAIPQLPHVAFTGDDWLHIAAQEGHEMELDPERITAERVVLLTSPNIFAAVFPPPAGRPAPADAGDLVGALLGLVRSPAAPPRPGHLELELVDGEMMTTPFENLYRADDDPLRVGDTIELTGLRVSVIAVAERGPTRISFQFDRP